MDLTEFDKDKEIDPSQLDVEAVRQASLYYKWAEKAVAALKQMAALEATVIREGKPQGSCSALS